MRKRLMLLGLIAMIANLLVIVLFFGQPSTATTAAVPSDLYGDTSLPYLPLHTLQPVY